ncbi:RNase adapter RapZ [Yunchengibacter salinarum]|uniref:RNase adapter RapZ n=1 Tax=Yunchengibacter salinarum TaxID=3133399 RepID=UPI0035B69E94
MTQQTVPQPGAGDDGAKGAGRRSVVLVTGLSGAGKTTALNAFEDLGYQTVDNLPLSLLENVLDMRTHGDTGPPPPLAVGADARTLLFSSESFLATVGALRRRGDVALKVLFMDAGNDVLMKRFSETRRRHPLAQDRLLRQAIKEERALMDDVRQVVDGIIDTTTRTQAETKRLILRRFSGSETAAMVVTFMSFGFAHGTPRDADLVFDVRFLRNPHYEPTLKPLTGLDERVANYVRADEGFQEFFDRVQGLIAFLLPRYVEEGKSYLTLAFGCTGGKHRSVMMAEAMARVLGRDPVTVHMYHRELPAAD